MGDKDETIKGGPGDGDQYVEDQNQDDDAGDQNGDQDKNKNQEPTYVTRDDLTAFQQSMMTAIRTAVGGQQQQPPKPATQPKDETAFNENEFWDDPVAALGKLEKRIISAVTQQTSQATSAQQFWNGFYAENDDLRKDEDLVQLTLNKHMKELAEMPVADASKRLADLTRERILGYSGKKNDNGGDRRHVHTEGSGHKIPKSPPPKDEGPKSLGDVIRARKEARQGGTRKAVAS